ncbi:MAG: ABC transporter permease [Candidatus Galacturonibacter soehngenii]|nr:ABC transporter permease [Candidatus Galacturonibacter soehngenii]
MDLIENSLLALSGLRANKMRTVLTMLGIIIGISSVITIVTIGNSVNQSVAKSMSDIGANKIEIAISQNYVIDENGNYNYEYIEQTENDMISEEMIMKYQKEFIDQIDSISLKKELDSTKVTDKDKYANVSVIGVNDGYAEVENIKILQGRFVTIKDMEHKKKLAVVSDKFIQNMFPNESPIGKEIAIPINKETNYFTIIGVYEYKVQGRGTGAERDLSTPVFLPITTVKQITHTIDGYTQMSVNGKAGIDMDQLTSDTKQYFANLFEKNENFKPEVYSMKEMLDEMNGMLKNITVAISAIAGISLLVGGIGVMNIMMVSITERTREIGTRKALGAQNSAILMQFIIEAMIICLLGGVIGVILGIGGGMLGAKLMGYPAIPSVAAILVAVGFSMLIGVFFGYYPANKAAKMNTIDALRYE